jgi:hypothetical protein
LNPRGQAFVAHAIRSYTADLEALQMGDVALELLKADQEARA